MFSYGWIKIVINVHKVLKQIIIMTITINIWETSVIVQLKIQGVCHCILGKLTSAVRDTDFLA